MSLIPIRIDHGLVARLCESAIDELEGVVLVRRGQPMPDDPAPEPGGDQEGEVPLSQRIVVRLLGNTYQPLPRISPSDDALAQFAQTFEVTCPESETEASAYALESAVARVVAALEFYSTKDEQSGHVLELEQAIVNNTYDTGMLHQLVGATIVIEGMVRREAGDELEDHHVG